MSGKKGPKSETSPAALPSLPGAVSQPTHDQPPYPTPARLSLGRSGPVVPTQDQLRFQLDHALARDAVHMQLDVAAVLRELGQRNLLQDAPPFVLRSAAASCGGQQDRGVYLRRPDLGRRLHSDSASTLNAYVQRRAAPEPGGQRIVVILADGLSAQAVERHALPLLEALLPLLNSAALLPSLPPAVVFDPLCIVTAARVAIGDEIGKLLGADLTVLLIGERPGLSAPDSLGVYLTWNPQPGRSDAERNCISNIRGEGLSYAAAAHRIAFYVREACRLQASGLALKDPEPPTHRQLP